MVKNVRFLNGVSNLMIRPFETIQKWLKIQMFRFSGVRYSDGNCKLIVLLSDLRRFE